MASSVPHTILLTGDDPNVYEGLAKASSNLVPGMLAERFSDGTIRPHSTAGGSASRSFVRERDYASGSIDSVFADGDTVMVIAARPGDRIYAFLPANAPAVVLGNYLESNGDGTLRLAAAGVAARASLTLGTGNAGVIFTATQPGADGNDISIQVIAGTSAAQTQVVTGNAIVIKPNTTTPGTTDTAALISSNLNSDAQASALVRGSLVGTGASAFAAVPTAATNLAGGADTAGAPASVVARAIESVDNSAVGARARLKVEVV